MVGRVSSPTFVGRREELTVLLGALERARNGTGSITTVAGEAGIGKSRLIAELANAARGTGATVLIGECPPIGEGELPYAPIVAALRALARDRGIDGLAELAGPGRDELAGLLPDLDPGGGRRGGDRSPMRLFDQLLRVLTAAARHRPLLLVVEDLHWSDRSTRDFLPFLVRAARDEPIALVVTYRSDELRRDDPTRMFVVELQRAAPARALTLTRMPRSEVRAQVAAILGTTPDPALVARLHERGDGNPFFTEELLASAGEAPAAGVPESLRDALLLRAAQCSPDALTVLRATAVSGCEIDHAMLDEVLDLDDGRLDAALRETIEHHLLVHDPESTAYAFRHSLVREAVYEDLLASERRSLHLALARAMEECPDYVDPQVPVTAEVAYHWYAAGERAPALDASLRAAREAEAVHAFGDALRAYERALELWDDVVPVGGDARFDRVETLRRASEAASFSGAPERAVALARAALAHVDPEDTVAVALAYERLGRRLWMAGRGDDALPEYGRAVELMPDDPPSAERAQVLAAEGQALMLCHQLAASEARCDEALILARRVGARAVEANVLNTMCANFTSAGDPRRGADAAAQARTIARELGLADELGRSYVNGSDALDHLGCVGEAIELAYEGIEICAELGAERLHGDCLRGEIIGRLIRTGRWAAAGELLDEVFDANPTGISAGNAYGNLCVYSAQRGDFAATRQAIALGEELVRGSGGSMWLAPVVEGRATMELWSGAPDAAARTVDACLETVADSELVLSTVRIYELGVRAQADLALAAAGDARVRDRCARRANALLARLDAILGTMRGPVSPRVAASRAAADAERARITASDAGAWARATAGWDACGDRYQAAYGRWRGAEALLTRGDDRAAAQDLVRDAHDVARELGAEPLAAAVEGLARRARLDLGQTAAEAHAASSALRELALTPREIEVLELLGEGLTNREIAAELFISAKTASVHVSRILAKLSVSNRAAAAAAAHQLGLMRAVEPLL